MHLLASVGQTEASLSIFGTQDAVPDVNEQTDEAVPVGPFLTLTAAQLVESVAATEQSPAAAPVVKPVCAPQVAAVAATQAFAAVHAQIGAMQPP